MSDETKYDATVIKLFLSKRHERLQTEPTDRTFFGDARDYIEQLEREDTELREALREWAKAQRAWEAEQRAHTITDDDAASMTKAEADVIRSEAKLLKAYDAALADK